MVKQPFTADHHLAIVTSVEAGHIHIERILIATQRLRGNYPARQLAAQVRHQRIAQLLIQRTRPQIVIRNDVLHFTGLIHHTVSGEGIRNSHLLNPQQTMPLTGGTLPARLCPQRQLVVTLSITS
ncbi:hypothetical protein D3C76_1526360 [compost metagenome]